MSYWLLIFSFCFQQTTAYDSNYLMGKFLPEKDPRFVSIDRKYRVNRTMYLRKEAYEAFEKMWVAAKKDDVTIVISSATRNFEYQKKIWEEKWNGKRRLEDGTLATEISDPSERAKKILQYSAMPGSSRHHWGTDFDINALNNAYFSKGKGKKLYDWLQKNAEKFGFRQPYSAFETGRATGYNEEKWHWSYFPIANELTNLSANLLQDYKFQGFDGAATATQIGIVKNYILGVDASCK
ncbi:MAG: M15 family metallopeptidase [Saprospiraceae bacterium]|nr:M15 family metallopeptidase [Saprospiraceae bacterium]